MTHPLPPLGAVVRFTLGASLALGGLLLAAAAPPYWLTLWPVPVFVGGLLAASVVIR